MSTDGHTPNPMDRSVQAEILDSLPACNLDALASRRDLLTINRLMGNFRWLRRQLRDLKVSMADPILELGAGDGHLGRQLMKSLPAGGYHALDQCSRPEDWPRDADWLSLDLTDFNDYQRFSCVVANLMLHHFEASELAQLGARLQAGSVQRILACEPCRRPIHKWQLRAGKWIGFNYVTLNDGCLSVEAGFRGDELPVLLGLNRDEWTWSIEETWMGAYRMRAERT